MDFALRCAYAHGTQALRTHLMSGREQSKLSWCARARACALPHRSSTHNAPLRFF